ncbi:hypothetical protein KIL84_004786 [Mauremys mutica]|uniref:Uncharacterized protein n=1 Tax=Mauremys mutica TaxID=74926 RepID=A0A9D3XKS7_9SAUR|nr:hypothetical protein KIL84_004786 [Mauremys mutica]
MQRLSEINQPTYYDLTSQSLWHDCTAQNSDNNSNNLISVLAKIQAMIHFYLCGCNHKRNRVRSLFSLKTLTYNQCLHYNCHHMAPLSVNVTSIIPKTPFLM